MVYDTPLNARVPEELARRLRLTAAVTRRAACHIVSALLDEGLPQVSDLLTQLQPAESGEGSASRPCRRGGHQHCQGGECECNCHIPGLDDQPGDTHRGTDDQR